jgi:putative transposase
MPRIVLTLLGDFLHWLTLGMRSHTRLAAENLFLRKQLAFYAVGSSHAVLTTPPDSRWSSSPDSSSGDTSSGVVQPESLVRWHRQGFRLFWRWRSRRRGRPQIPPHLQTLTAEMARANQTWGEERIAAELLLNWASPSRLGRSDAK